MSQVAGPSTIAPSDGSRTIIVHDSQPREGEAEREQGVLHVRAARRNQPRVTWSEEVVDNEGMGKKKTKICCIFHKQRQYYESSSSDSDSSDSRSDSDSGRARLGGRLRNRRHQHPHDHDGEGGGNPDGQATRDQDGSTTVHELSDGEFKPNAYERQPGKRKRKGKGKEVDKSNEPAPQPQSH